MDIFIRVRFCRYADDTHHSQKAHFLGFDITIYNNNEFVQKNAIGRIKRNRAGIVGLEVPRKVQVAWIKKYTAEKANLLPKSISSTSILTTSSRTMAWNYEDSINTMLPPTM